MEMSGEELINAPKSVVWDALNDPEILKQAIPGCESVEKESDTDFSATVKVKVGPVKATFKGQVTLSNIDAPNGYTITGEGKGGAAGFGKGGADIKLTEADGGTLLSYDVKASVGGKMAQIGSRLIDSTAKKLASEFFATFNELVSSKSDGASTEQTSAPAGEEEIITAAEVIENPDVAEPTHVDTPEKSLFQKPGFLVAAGILIVAVLYYLSQSGGAN
ncbi:CoxG family protein [Sneathiella glossodoripedis]|uniref:CoxG family protein n=1 Tax=Sneathiella glossodoripedis TaxID=418853 RepID=UPI00046F97D9|nr:carbon monoxide dehydrogenase subunit G [Sneathiella glossodoripedis]